MIYQNYMIMALHFKLYNFISIFKIKAIYIIKVLILKKKFNKNINQT